MPRFRPLDLETFDSEINKTFRKLRKNREASNINMTDQIYEENKFLRDYVMPSIDGATMSIQRLIQPTHFEIKATIIQMIQNIVQFHELSHEDPN